MEQSSDWRREFLYILCHAFGEEVAPHLRTIVTRLNEDETLAFQDVTYDQWDQGAELNKSA